jgi:hypothetical protein
MKIPPAVSDCVGEESSDGNHPILIELSHDALHGFCFEAGTRTALKLVELPDDVDGAVSRTPWCSPKPVNPQRTIRLGEIVSSIPLRLTRYLLNGNK